MLQRLDIEPKRWGNGVDVLAIELFQDCGFSSIIQPSCDSDPKKRRKRVNVQEQQPDLFLFFLQLPQDGVQAHFDDAHMDMPIWPI